MRGVTVGSQPCPPADLNLTDVLDVIRNADPVTFQEFFAPAAAAAGMSSSYPPSAAGSVTSGAAAAPMMMMPAVAVPGSVLRPDPARSKKHAYVRVVEQPASKGLRFRYECEGRSAGSIPGASSTNENKTFPTIQVVGYKGRAVVVVSCVTADSPYRAHPHNLVGKEGCKKGVCTIEMDPETMSCSFPSLGIQCVKKKEIEPSLLLREQIRVDPFQTGFSHKDNPQTIDLNCVRLCFQVFLEGNEKGAFTFALKPVVSDPIYDKKARNDLTICRMTECSASVAGGKEILLFCEKVTKDDIQVRFYEEDDDGRLIWEGFGEFQPSDVHKQYGICFRTPRYQNLELEQTLVVKMQLRRPSDGAVSDSRSFEFLPLDGGRGFWAAKRMKTNYNVFSNILAIGNNSNNTRSLNSFSMESSVEVDEPMRRKIPSMSSSLASPTHGGTVTVSPRIPAPSSSTSIPAPPPPPPLPLIPSSQVTMRSSNNFQIQHDERPLRVPPKSAPVNLRPISDISDISSVSSVATTVTGRSVNDLLSLAAEDEMDEEGRRESLFSNFEIPSQPNENISIQQLMMTTSAQRPAVQQPNHVVQANPVAPAEVKPVKLEDIVKDESEPMDLDVNTLYDDVLQCVYDDVDTKYDTVQLMVEEATPPVPPARKQRPPESISRPAPPTPETETEPEVVKPDKPLPDTPSKVPAILTKFAGGAKKSNAKEIEEQKKKEKAEKEAEKLREKEEKEKEKERKKQEELEKKKNKKKQKTEEEIVTSPRQSLFQRLFSNKSKSGDDELGSPSEDGVPPIPAHGRTDGNGNPEDDDDLLQIDENADLAELQQMIDSGNLDQLDNMVSEFAREFADEEGSNSSTGVCLKNNNNNNGNNSSNATAVGKVANNNGSKLVQ